MSSAPAVEHALVEAFAAEGGKAMQRRRLHEIEDRLSPAQFAAILPALDRLAEHKRELVATSPVAQVLRLDAPQPFIRTEIAPGVEFCSAGGSRRNKELIVAFGCRPGRLFMPISVFLQMLPADRFDVVMLRDRTLRQFLNGVPDYAETIPALCARLAADFKLAEYRRVITYGASMGGLTALRAGPLLGARKAISVGGTFPWAINWLLNEDPGIPAWAYDRLCACMQPTETEMVCVYGADYPRDAGAVEKLRRFQAVTEISLPGIDHHNVIYQMFLDGALPAFYAKLFDFEVQPLPGVNYRSVPTKRPSGRLKKFVYNFVLLPLGIRKRNKRARPPKVI